MDEVFSNDLIHIFELHEAVPDGLGIDDHRRTVLALVETAGLVGADEMFESGVFDGILEGGFELLAAVGKAAGTGCGFIALIGADKEMVFEFRHGGGLLSLPRFATADRAGRVSF